MSAIFNYCDSVAKSSPQANLVIDQIKETTTIEQFEELRTRFPKFQLDHADLENRTILHIAAKVGNIPLIEYIVRQAPQLLERGDRVGHTPLFFAATQSHIAATNSLIALGANVNVMQFSADNLVDADTALLNWIVAYALFFQTSKNENWKNNNFNLMKMIVKLLIKNGAQLYSTIFKKIEDVLLDRDSRLRSQETKAFFESIIGRIQLQLAEERRQSSETVYKFSPLPKDLCDLVADYS